MVQPTKHLLLLLAISFIHNFSFGQMFGFNELLEKSPDSPTVFCVANNEGNTNTIEKNGITIKFQTNKWLFVNATPRWINEHSNDGSISEYYFEHAPPMALSDTSRVFHYVNQVHDGQAPLGTSYTGAGVIVGIVDQGLDFTHPDFLDANGNTRVLRYWDHTVTSPVNPPAPYGYGELWDSTAINLGICTSSEETTAHGTSVTGIAVGNGMANGSNKGMAPDANIVVVESNFSLPNWTLTIADAVDYIFKVADSLDMPAVVNLSLGSYLGSHDGNDPAAEYIETLLDEKPGRIVVAAAGNSGGQLPYHQQGNVSADTNFVWFEDNPSCVLGSNAVFFDLYADMTDATWSFAIGADTQTNYDFRGRTNFHFCQSSIGTPIYDTIWNGSNRIATIEAYTEIIDGSYHLQMVTYLDSTNYLMRFETTGSGKYDLWSGAFIGYNNMVTTLPTVGQMPDIVYYVSPDIEQSIVSSWNCSDKVVTVGNFRNRLGHIDNNMNPYINPTTPPGEISPNSSHGPNRHGVNKPDVIASGDVSLSAGPLWLLGNAAYNSLIDSGGWHVRNGGTSMASPIVSGIAALYLERCRYATYADFKTDLMATNYADAFTGAVPNNIYGYGKANAFDLLQEQTLESTPSITYNSGSTILSSTSTNYQWFLDGTEISNETNQEHSPQIPYGDYTVMTINDDGCYAVSPPLTITAGLDELELLIKISPNPTSDLINVETDESIIKVIALNMGGKQIELKSTGGNNYDVSYLNSGTYILQIETQSKTYKAKLVRL